MVLMIPQVITTRQEHRRADVENLYSVNRQAGFPLDTKTILVAERSQLSLTICWRNENGNVKLSFGL